MDIILLGVTIVSLAVALVMSVTAWRLTRDEKTRAAARVAALSVAAEAPERDAFVRQSELPTLAEARFEKPVKAPWSPSPVVSPQVRDEAGELRRDVVSSGFLGATEVTRDDGGRQKSLAFAALILFVVLSGGLVWMMSGPRGTSAVAMGPNSPLELMSLTHARQNEKLAVSGLVRNPTGSKPVEHLSAVVFLFDRAGTFITSSRANVDFLKIAAGDESPFVVSLDAPAAVARYRVSFRTDDGIVPHIDRRGSAPAEGEQAVNVSAK